MAGAVAGQLKVGTDVRRIEYLEMRRINAIGKPPNGQTVPDCKTKVRVSDGDKQSRLGEIGDEYAVPWRRHRCRGRKCLCTGSG